MDDLKFTITFDSNGLPVLKNVSAATDEVKDRFQQASTAALHTGDAMTGLGKAIESPYQASRALRTGLAQVVSEMGIGGPAAHEMAFALFDSAEGFTRMTGAAIGAGVGLSLAIQSFKDLSDNQKAFEKLVAGSDLKAVEGRIEEITKLQADSAGILGKIFHPLQALSDLGGLITGTNKTLEELAALNEKRRNLFDEATRDLSKHFQDESAIIQAEIQQDPFAKLAAERAAAIDKLTKEMGKLLIPSQLQQQVLGALNKGFELKGFQLAAGFQKEIDAQTRSLEHQGAAAGAVGTQLTALAIAEQQAAVNAKFSGTQYAAMIPIWNRMIDSVERYKKALDLINQGQQAVPKFEQQFGTRFNFSDKLDAFNLAGQFAPFASAFFDKPGEKENLGNAFASFVQQSFSLGVKDIRGLLAAAGVGDRIIEGLISDLRNTRIGQQTVDVEVLQNNRNAFGGPSGPPTRIEQQTVDITGQALADQIPSASSGAERVNKEMTTILETFGKIGTGIDEFTRQWAKLKELPATELAVTLDLEKPKSEIEEIKSLLRTIPERVSVFIDIQSNAEATFARLQQLYNQITGLQFFPPINN